MSDKNKNKKLEELSTEELHSRIKEDKKKAGRSVVMMFAAVIAIIVIGIAWFVANTKVKLNTGTISSADPNSVLLASVGSRQTAESGYLKNDDGSNVLTAGEEKKYEKYIDAVTGTVTETPNTTYQVGSANLAWYLSGSNVAVSPGARGRLEFYIIPNEDNLKSVTVKLETSAYQYSNRDSEPKSGNAKKVDNEGIQNLVKGHILLFRSLDNTNGYSGWLGENGSFTIEAKNIPAVSDASGDAEEAETQANGSGEAVFQKGVPYKVTLYWVWPKYFRNYVYNNRNIYGDLFASDESADYKDLLNFVKAQTELSGSKLFKAADSTGDGTGSSDKWDVGADAISNNMAQSAYDLCTKYYNQADEYIGTNADFLYIEATVQR